MDTRNLDSDKMRVIGDDWPSIRRIDDLLSTETARGRANEPELRRETVAEAVQSFGWLLMIVALTMAAVLMLVMAADIADWLREGMPQPGAPMIYLEDLK